MEAAAEQGNSPISAQSYERQLVAVDSLTRSNVFW